MSLKLKLLKIFELETDTFQMLFNIECAPWCYKWDGVELHCMDGSPEVG